ncbi:MAG: hypothetical protein HXL47_07630 [Solobacterium sp.]|jgi:hypothetical protein|nr:hypothetical protein [Solobacterium sp.]
MRNQKQNKKQQFNNVRIEVPVKFNDRLPEAVKEELTGVLANPIIEQLTLNVFAFRSVINNDPEVKGNIIVGNIIKYDTEKEVLVVDIYERFAEVIDSIQDRIAFVFTSFDSDSKVNKINRVIIEEAKK